MSLAGIIAGLAAIFSQQIDSGAGATPVPNSPAPASPAPQQPTSPWQIDYGAERCLAVRNYGTGRAEVTLTLERAAYLDILNIGIVARSIAAQPTVPDFGLEIGEGDAIGAIPGRVIQLENNRRLISVEVPLDTLRDRLRGARSLRFSPARGEPFYLQLTNMAAVIDRLDHCYQGLLESWGVDVAAIRALRSPPEAIDPENWISRNQLPSFAGHADGAVLLTITAEGRVAACRTLDTSGLRAVDENICRQMVTRARFTPATGADGAPAATQVVRRIRYQTPS